MGAWAQAITQGLGRAGNEAYDARQLGLDEKAKQLALLQSQMALRELQQRLKTQAAPQFTGSYTGADNRQHNVVRDPVTGALSDQAGGALQPKENWTPVLDRDGNYVAFDKTTGKMSRMELDGKPVQGVPKGKSGPLTVDGKPIGVWRAGMPLTPDSPEWQPSDAVQLANYLRGYNESEEVKNKRIQLAANSRVAAYMKTRMYGAMDADTGGLVFVTPAQVTANPGKYAPAAPAVSAKTRTGIFQDIDVAQGYLNDAIAKLPNDAFNADARAQISAALRSSDPSSAWHEFLTSDVATTLSDSQVEYVTALVNMQESALALRSIAGMGQGSDKMRDAITKMLPGAGTPSKVYAIRQMQLFRAEVQALKMTVPGIGEPRSTGSGNTPPPGATIVDMSNE